jgi:CubicO group peptidase (beta-lactamase class C family)
MAAATVGRGEELREESVDAFQAAVDQAVRDRVIAGGAWWVERGGVSVNGVSGEAVKVPEEERRAVEEGTIFDVASLTKVVATTPCVMRLVEAGAVDLTAPVKAYVPAFEGEGRERITVRQLLTHTSGLKPGLSRVEAWSGYDEGIRMACETVPLEMPDEVFC